MLNLNYSTIHIEIRMECSKAPFTINEDNFASEYLRLRLRFLLRFSTKVVMCNKFMRNMIEDLK